MVRRVVCRARPACRGRRGRRPLSQQEVRCPVRRREACSSCTPRPLRCAPMSSGPRARCSTSARRCSGPRSRPRPGRSAPSCPGRRRRGPAPGWRRHCAAGRTCATRSPRRPAPGPTGRAGATPPASASTTRSIGVHGDALVGEDRLRSAVQASGGDPRLLLQEVDRLLGKAWDEELEPFRYAGAGAPVRWLHRVG